MIEKFRSFLKVDFHKDRIYGFDIIRAIAIISVLLGHGAFILPGEPNSFYMHSYEFLDGVFVFFILSGFLIGQLLIHIMENKDMNRETLISFWKRRLLRTLPAYYFILIVLIILSLLTIKGFGNLKTLSYFVLLQNFCTSHPYFFAEAWTLSIEVWFYIFIPLFLFILKGYYKLEDKKALLITLGTFILMGFLFRCYYATLYTEIDAYIIDQMFRKQVVTRIDSVTYGVIGAYVFRYYNTVWFKYKNAFLIAGILVFLYTKFPLLDHGNFYRLVMFYVLQSISFLLILPYFSAIKSGKGFVFTVLTTISYVSFSIYLINLNIVQIFLLDNINFGSITGNYLIALKYFLYVVISILGGIFMYKKIELPFMNMRKKRYK